MSEDIALVEARAESDSLRRDGPGHMAPAQDERHAEHPSTLVPARTSTAEPAFGVLCGFDSNGLPLVKIRASSDIRGAISTVPLDGAMIGRSVLVLFEYGSDQRPIIIGLLPATTAQTAMRSPAEPERRQLAARVDGETVVFTAERQIELRCGAASITLTRAGKVLIRGAYVLSRSKGANKIKGAYVDIN